MISDHLFGPCPPAVTAWFGRLDRREVSWVRRQNALTRRRWIRRLALTLSLLGAGGIYPLIAAALFWAGGPRRSQVFWAAGLAALAGHLIYPFVKGLAARRRPFVADPDLVCPIRPLDRYSFPSGHAMTACAVFVVLSAAYPAVIPVAIAGWMLLAWAQLACAHHYPSDLWCGAALGAAVAVPIARALLF